MGIFSHPLRLPRQVRGACAIINFSMGVKKYARPGEAEFSVDPGLLYDVSRLPILSRKKGFDILEHPLDLGFAKWDNKRTLETEEGQPRPFPGELFNMVVRRP